MKLLNLGCGNRYSIKPEWTNIDFVSHSEHVIPYNLLNGIPFPDNTFDLVYHSHVLEHFPKKDGEKFITECLRVLKPGGILRIAIPDLEQIARKYLQLLNEGLQDESNKKIRSDYDWMLIEMYDQTVRNHSGGEMADYLFQDVIPNETFVMDRIGEEGRGIRKNFLKNQEEVEKTNKPLQFERKSHLFAIKQKIKRVLLRLLNIDPMAHEIGKFRLSGEIHQWMYDRYSLSYLLRLKGADQIEIRDAFNSHLRNWEEYDLDGKDCIIRKPDSLFIEAIKK